MHDAQLALQTNKLQEKRAQRRLVNFAERLEWWARPRRSHRIASLAGNVLEASLVTVMTFSCLRWSVARPWFTLYVESYVLFLFWLTVCPRRPPLP